MPDLTPYSTAAPFMGVREGWLAADDAERLGAYMLYESMYRNDPSAYKIVMRGSEANPIYVPSSKTIIEACNRFLAKGWTYAIDPRLGSEGEQLAVRTLLDVTFKREKMWSKFAMQKRWGLVRGDAVWHIIADPTKPVGKRISILDIDPGMYFPIEDGDKVVGVHLVEVIPVAPGATETAIRRQTYRKTENGRITYECTWWESGAWDDRPGSGQDLKAAKKVPEGYVAVKLYELPEQITSIPVYHIKNNPFPMAPYGVSELQGLERIASGLTQAVSDEDLSLALAGLGVYTTTSGPPVDENDEETDWRIGPGYVAEIDDDAEFKRINGITTVTPYQDHIAMLERFGREASGTPDIAIGSVDVQVAESGIALQFKMGPLLAKNQEKEVELLGTYDHMLYDLTTMWFVAFEELPETDVIANSIIDDPMPIDRMGIINEVSQLLADKVVSVAWASAYLAEKLGYEFPESMLSDIVTEQAAIAKATNIDPFMSRVARELGESDE